MKIEVANGLFLMLIRDAQFLKCVTSIFDTFTVITKQRRLLPQE